MAQKSGLLNQAQALQRHGSISPGGVKDAVLVHMNKPELGLLTQVLGRDPTTNKRTGLLQFEPGGHSSDGHSAGGGASGGGSAGGGGGPGGTGSTADHGNQSSPEGGGGSQRGVGGGGGGGPAASPTGLGAAIGGMFGGELGNMSVGQAPSPGQAVDDRSFMTRAIDGVKAAFNGTPNSMTADPGMGAMLTGIAGVAPGMGLAMGLTRGLQAATGSMGTPGLSNDHGDAGTGGPTPQDFLRASTGQVGTVKPNVPTGMSNLGLNQLQQAPTMQQTVPGYGFNTPAYDYWKWG